MEFFSKLNGSVFYFDIKMKCEHYPHVHTYTCHAPIHINTSTQAFFANLYKHNNTITYEYFYTILLLHIHTAKHSFY